jgi:hypothetical protein
MQKRANAARVPLWLCAVAGVVLASTLVGSDVDAGSSRGCEGVSSDDAGRVSACAEKSAEETPDER